MTLQVRPLAEKFVAEIRGIDLRIPLTQERLDQLYDAFLEYGVLVIPGQAITIEQQLDFARTFGPLHVLPNRPGVGRRVNSREIDDVSNLDAKGDLAGMDSEKVIFTMGNQLWHSDLSFCDNPAHASMLHAIEIAQDGGETEFCDLYSAHDDLPPATRERISTLTAEHSLAHSRVRSGLDEKQAAAIEKLRPPAHHPLVRIHPETGRKSLFVGAHVSRIFGLATEEGEALIEELVRFASRPDCVYRHRWAVHDLVIWDNRRTLHRGVPYDVDKTRRVMHRATVEGDGPTMAGSRVLIPDVRRRRVRVAGEAH